MANPVTGNRRDILRGTAGIIAGAAIIGNARTAAAAIEAGGGRKIYKAAKWDMIAVEGSGKERFALQGELGLDWMELISPSDLNPADDEKSATVT